MVLRRLGGAGPEQPPAPAQGSGFLTPEAAGMPQPNGITNANQQSVMPAGPDVDVSSILGPLIDGSYAVAQGQAAIMAGVRVPQNLTGQGGTPLPGTHPLSGTHPLPGTHPLAPEPSQVPAAPARPQVDSFPQVPPQLVNTLVQRILTGLPTNTQLERTPEIEQMLAERFSNAVSQMQANIPAGTQGMMYHAVMNEILGFGPLEALLQDDSISEVMVNGPKQVWI